MKTLPSCICIFGLAGLASAGVGTALMDQIGPDDGTNIDASNMLANQYFEAAYSTYSIGAVDDFDNAAGVSAGGVDMVISGWNGYAGIDGVSGLQANFYTTPDAAGANLAGDLASSDHPGMPTADPNWMLAGYDLIGVSGSWSLQAGMNYVAMIPTNEFAANGQTGIAIGFEGDLNCWQANPGGGFGFGPLQAAANNLAYRVMSGSSDPCDIPLGSCNADITGPEGVPDGLINVDDVLGVIGTFGQVGDGTSRPMGDVFPLPSGDCAVTVDDLLEVIGAFGGDCLPRGACCYGLDGCMDDMKEADCAGEWLGEGSSCADCVVGACCFADGSCDFVYEPDCDGAFQGQDVACADVVCQEAPANTVCSGAIAITDGDTGIDNTTALTDGPADFNLCDNFGEEGVYNDLWYSYGASCDGTVTVSTCDTVDFDSRLAVYDACDGTMLVCNDDCGGANNGLSSELGVDLTAGDSVVIRVGSFTEGGTGTGVLSVTCAAPAPGACCVGVGDCIDGLYPADCADFGGDYMGDNSACADVQCGATGDTCAEAATMVEGANPFDTSSATDSGFGEPDDTMCEGTYLDWTGSPDVWGRFEVPGDGLLTVSLCDSASYDTSLVLYEGGDCAALTQVACNGDSTVETGCQSYYSGIYDHAVSGGSVIYIRIGGWQGATGPGTCTISFLDAGASGACCVAGDCVGEMTNDDCAGFGGVWFNGSACADITCPAPYVAGGCDVDENSLAGCVCFVDGDDSETDCNGGTNLASPTYTDLTIGQSICGTSSVFVDGPTGGTYRDLDWWVNDSLNAGGSFDFTIGADSTCLILVVNIDAGTVDYVADHLAGFMNTTTIEMPAGNWSAVSTVSDWNTAWTCGSGLETYTMQVD